jgi:ATP-dependent helicase HepA
MKKAIEVGAFIEANNGLGYGKVIDICNDMVTVEYFHSISSRQTLVFVSSELKVRVLERQTRCYYYDENKKLWVIGRVMGYLDGEYEVDFPDRYSTYIPSKFLYVRSKRPVLNPVEVLGIKGHETAFFNKNRAVFVEEIMRQRAVARGMTGLLSSKILLLPHQIEVVRRVLEDPIPRYLLADEVGLGKTIEAGVIIRQFLLDDEEARILLIVPPFLLEQWKREMTEKFYVDEYGDRIIWKTTDELPFSLEKMNDIKLTVIDEAHELAKLAFSNQTSDQEQYHCIEKISQMSNGLLLLSATPVLNNEKEFLAMLHLLDPDNYSLKDVESFTARIQNRQNLGRLLLAFREEASSFLVRKSLAGFLEMFPEDYVLKNLIESLQAYMQDTGHNPDMRKKMIRQIRVHLTETYRLHHRLLRNRRDPLHFVLTYGRDHRENGHKLRCEYDLDERTGLLEELLEEWRQSAWASERHRWEEENTLQETAFMRLYLLLLETSGSDPELFRDVVTCRLHKTSVPRLFKDIREEYFSLLVDEPFFEGEVNILENMLRSLQHPSEDGDRTELLVSLLEHCAREAQRKSIERPKVVIFTNYPSVCEKLIDELVYVFGEAAVAGHCELHSKKQVELSIESFRTEIERWILVCDRSGEVGRNLQFADHIIHFDLPLVPNRLEQRIGRLDRIGREKAFVSTVFVGPDQEFSMHEAYFKFLKDGLGVFSHSISSLQFFIDAKMPEVYKAMYIRGIDGLQGICETLHNVIEEEKVKIAEQNALDEIDSEDQQAIEFYETLIEYESNPEAIRKRMEAWICDALKFRPHAHAKGRAFSYEPTRETLIPLTYLRTLHQKSNRQGCYDRNSAQLLSDSKMLRIGDPFIDFLSKYVHWDDRGQTYAIWRQVPGWNQDDWMGFCFKYVVEGDTSVAEQILHSFSQNGHHLLSLRRKMDRYFPPIYQTLYLNTNGIPVNDPVLQAHLSEAFLKREDGGFDSNLTKERIAVLEEYFADEDWPVVCNSVREESEQLLQQSDSFIELCTERERQAKRQFETMLTQMSLRTKKDISSFNLEFEESFHQALLEGIRRPKCRLDSVGFIIVSGKEISRKKGSIRV